MNDDLMLKCLIAFILGWLATRMMGNGFSVGILTCPEGSINIVGKCIRIPSIEI